MSGCNGDCGSCGSDCKDRKPAHLSPNEFSSVKKIYAVVSGKGGVGKSSVTCMLASAMQQRGKQTAVLDADVTGPSVPKMFGLHERAEADASGIQPAVTTTGIRVMSVNLLLEAEDAPVVWRGPVISGAIQQFFTEVAWGDIDYMFVDMPPGTGDVPLTVFQSLKVDGVIVVTTPQDLVGLIVKKAVNMANMMNVPVVGIVENMSVFTCPDCGKQHHIFGKSTADAAAAAVGTKVIASLPIDPRTPALADKGAIELADTDALQPVVDLLLGD